MTVQDEQIPVTVITGFLGAGKTTLLNHILTTNHGFKFAVIENEFGEIGIDGDLVQQKEQVAEEIINMDNGCLCCTVREDLVKTVRKLLTLGKRFDGIIIETTGMADPGPVVQTFYTNPDLQRRTRIDGVITVVDSKHCQQHLWNEEIEAGKVNECLQQVAFADRILLNKVDLVSRQEMAQLKADIMGINKLADMIECQNSVVDPKSLLNINKFSLEKVLDFDPDFLKEDDGHHHHGDEKDHSHCDHEHGKCDHKDHDGHDHHDHKDHDHDHKDHDHDHKDHDHDHKDHDHDHDHKDHSHCDHEHGKCDHDHDHDHDHKDHSHCDHEHGKCDHEGHSHHAPVSRHDTAVSSVGIKLNPGESMNLGKLQHWLGELCQTKGEELYRYKGIIAVKGFDQKFVFQGVHMMLEGDFLGDWDVPDSERVSKFVFIGKDLDRELLTAGFKACVAEPLRFEVGTIVYARVKNGWGKGEIIKQWCHGNPYRIRLFDEKRTEVFGPMDDDRVVQNEETRQRALDRGAHGDHHH